MGYCLLDTFLELLEPYILKDMLGSLPPEVIFSVETFSLIISFVIHFNSFFSFLIFKFLLKDNASSGRAL